MVAPAGRAIARGGWKLASETRDLLSLSARNRLEAGIRLLMVAPARRTYLKTRRYSKLKRAIGRLATTSGAIKRSLRKNGGGFVELRELGLLGPARCPLPDTVDFVLAGLVVVSESGWRNLAKTALGGPRRKRFH